MILWLTNKYGYSAATKGLLLTALKAHGVASTDIMFNSLHHKVPDLAEYPKKKVPVSVNVRAALHALGQDCSILQPHLIICNDEATLRCITGEPYTLSQVRGSVYEFQGIPVIVLDAVGNMYAMNHGSWMWGLDMAKVVRFAHGKQNKLPAFNYRLASTMRDIERLVEESAGATLIATDRETFAGNISCTGYTYDFGGHLTSVCVPFFDPWTASGCFWPEGDFSRVLRALKHLHANPVPKALQNGMYDCAYDIEAGMPLNNYIYDTQYLMHSIWCEAPKALHEISSYFLDNYRYWKDDAKGVQEDGFGKTHADIERYWRYNGLDTYYTWLDTRELVSRISKLPWAMANYSERIALALGPCLAASLRGLRTNKARHAFIMAKKSAEAHEGLENVRRLVHVKDYNPRSKTDAAWFIYDVCGAKVTRLQKGKRSKYGLKSCDEKVLKLMKEQGNPMLNVYIRRHLDAKKPAAVISKYGNMQELCRNGRFLSWLNPSGTTTSRFNSGGSQYWTGTNAQNIPMPIRELFVADDNYFLLDIDYSASDDRFVAYESQDPEKMRVVEDRSIDIHCYHCSIFFSMDYTTVVAGWKADEPWCVDEPKGVRQVTKKVTHGRNYCEGGATMYNLMGRDAVVATAVALGYPKAEGWTDKELIGICNKLSDKYDHPRIGLYKRIRPWQEEIVTDLAKRGGLATTAFGFTRKFFGKPGDHKTQRELASFFGQGDTGGNVNRALRKIWYSGIDDGKSCLFLLQVHDSLLFAVHKDHPYIVDQIKAIMEEPVTIHGRSMYVPAAPKVGLTWAKKMLSWKPGMTYNEIAAFEDKVFGEKYKATPEGLDEQTIALLNNMVSGATAEDYVGGDETDDDPVLGEDEDDQIGASEYADLT